MHGFWKNLFILKEPNSLKPTSLIIIYNYSDFCDNYRTLGKLLNFRN